MATMDAMESIEEKGAVVGTKPKVQKEGDYSDPVYHTLSKINGQINRLTKKQLQDKLCGFGLDTRGVKEVLSKRLKNYYKRRKLMKARIRPPGEQKFDYLVVIDFEATCDDNNTNYRHEIIEFPAVLVDVESRSIVDHFQEYVRPLINPTLTSFCSNLTGITQAIVDGAATFPEVLGKAEEWMLKHSLGSGKTFAVATDGPWDMYRFMYNQCELSRVEMPQWSKRWINIRKAYCNFYQCKRVGIDGMLQNLGMKFEGSPHCGLDDAKNISRIAMKLMNDGCVLSVNEYVQVNQNPVTAETYARYEPLIEDGCDDSDSTVGDDARTRRAESGRSEACGLEGRLEQMRLETAQEGQNVGDLLSYYKLQNV